MKIVLDSEPRARNKLTITAGKKEVRIKFQRGATEDERGTVFNYFLTVVDNSPEEEYTRRGSGPTEKLLKYGIVMYREPQKLPIRFGPDGTLIESKEE